jgi:hypothetical protein
MHNFFRWIALAFAVGFTVFYVWSQAKSVRQDHRWGLLIIGFTTFLFLAYLWIGPSRLGNLFGLLN